MHTTTYRWIQTYAPQLEKLIRWYQGHTNSSWRVDETYISVCGQWLYFVSGWIAEGVLWTSICHSVETQEQQGGFSQGAASPARLGPLVINTDRNPAYGEAIRKLKSSKLLDESVDHRQVKYLNNQIEADHGAIKRRIRSMLKFKSAKTAYATLKGIEVTRMFRKVQCILLKPGVQAEVAFFNKLFRCVLNMLCVFATEPRKGRWERNRLFT